MGNWINRWHVCIGSKGAYFEGDNEDFEMPKHTTLALQLSVIVNIISFEMLMCITYVISLLEKARERVLSYISPSW